MALITKLGLDDVYKRLKGQWREIRAAAVRLRAVSAAGPVSFSAARDYYESLYSAIAFCDAEIAKFGGATLIAYARAQEDVADYDPATAYGQMTVAANAVLTHIAAALPANSAHTIEGGKVIEPAFPSAAQGMVTLRGLLDSLIGTIGAP